MTAFSATYSLGIDIGTTKVAVAIVDSESRHVIATHSRAHNSDVSGLPAGRSEQSVPRILSTLDACMDALPVEAKRAVVCIGVTGQMHGVVLWNAATGAVSNLITWQDQRCLEDGFLERLRRSTGDGAAQSGYGTSTLAWLAEYAPEVFELYTSSATIHDYAVSLMTGSRKPLTDPSDAASFGFFDLRSRTWREDRVTKAGIHLAILPTIRPSGEPVGLLQQDMATRWGIQEGAQVGNALGDNQASLFGSLTRPDSQIALTIGTGAQLSVVVPTVPSGEISATSAHEFRPYIGESYIACAASLSGGRALAAFGRALESFMKSLGVEPLPSLDEIQGAMHREGMTRSTTSLRANASLGGERHDLSRRGSFEGLSFENFSVGDMTAALCRGLVTSLRDALPPEYLSGRREVVGSGNALSRSPLVQQVIRESFGCELTLQEGAEPTACGAASLASQMCR
jgi:sedoheptulokinase